jgi:radical SAM superfamily enzyme YgiQ (UPF0313 family)
LSENPVPALKIQGPPNSSCASIELIVSKIRRVFNGQYRRILLIQPPQFSEELLNVRIAKNKRYYNYPPYGLGLLCTNLKKRDYKVRILDLNFELLAFIHKEKDETYIFSNVTNLWQKKVKRIITDFQPDMVGVSCMFTMSHEITIKITDLIKSYCSNLPVVAGGVHVTNAPDIFLKEGKSIDFVFLYEGDHGFCDFLDFVNDKDSSESLTQIGTLIDGKYRDVKERHIPSPDTMNVMPDYLDLAIGENILLGEIGNFRYWLPENSRVSSVLTNRGCRGRCSFCSVRSFNGAGVRSRSVESVVDEIEELKSKYNINHITWLDDDLFYNTKRTVQLFNEIVKRRLNITWDAMNGIIASAVAVHPETIHSAAESGCIAVNYGVESGSPEVLRKVHKPSSIKHCLIVGELMKKYPQIYTRTFLIIGFPNETFRQILSTVDLAQAMGADWNGVQKLTPLPSTEIVEQMVDEKLIDDENLVKSGYSGFLIREAENQRLREANEKKKAREFTNFFDNDLEMVPTKEELDDVWFLADYKVNYEKILGEKEPLRLRKMHCFLKDVTERMTIDNPLSTLFLGIVEYKLDNLDKCREYLSVSKGLLVQSEYWQIRFDVLNINRLYDLPSVETSRSHKFV